MPVPSNITDLSTSAGSNSPAGTDSIGTTADDFIRALSAFIAQLRDGSKNLELGTVTAPTLAFTGDSNTGIYSNAADNVAIAAAGALVAKFNTSGITVGDGRYVNLAPTGSGGSAPSMFIYPSGSATINAGVGALYSANSIACAYIGTGTSPWAQGVGVDPSGRFIHIGTGHPAFHAYSSAAQTSGTVFIFGTEVFDHGSCYNSGTGVFTAPIGGKYHFDASPRIDTNSGTGSITVVLRKNSSTTLVQSAHYVSTIGTFTETFPISLTTYLAANDTVTVEYLSGFAGTFTAANSQGSTFSGYLIG